MAAASTVQGARSKVVHARLIQAQFSSYLQKFQTTILGSQAVPKAKAKTGAKWIVELEDTILFPAGGGQPSDQGTLRILPEESTGGNEGEFDVIEIERQEEKVLHYVKSSGRTTAGGEEEEKKLLQNGRAVEITLNWKRRFDHMQQHTGQHLLSALAFQMFQWKTSSWNLGEDCCYIDFEPNGDVPIQTTAIEQLQRRANEVIRSNHHIDVHVEEIDPSSSSSSTTSSSSSTTSPSEGEGKPRFGVRTVNISGVDDFNRCCGTHLHSTGDLQAIVFAPRSAETKDSKLFFWAGDRVISRFSESLLREQQITSLLTTGPNNHITSIERLQKERRSMNSKIKRIEDEVSSLLIDKLLLESPPERRVYSLIRTDDEPAQLNKLASAFKARRPDAIIFLVSHLGGFLITGPEGLLSPEAFRRVVAVFQAKGGGKGGVFQGTIPPANVKTALSNFPEALAILEGLAPSSNDAGITVSSSS